MNRLIKEGLEALLQDTSNSKRLGRRIIALAGFLDAAQAPDAIQQQLGRLSRLLILQDAFDALLEPMTLLSRSGLAHSLDANALHTMLGSLEQARKQIADVEEINYPLLMGWLVSAAEARNVLRTSKGQAK